eukprot:403337881
MTKKEQQSLEGIDSNPDHKQDLESSRLLITDHDIEKQINILKLTDKLQYKVNSKGEKPGISHQITRQSQVGSLSEILPEKSQSKPTIEMIKFRYFFRFLTQRDKILMSLGSVAAIIAGALTPTLSIIIGEIATIFDPDNPPEEIKSSMQTLSGIISLVEQLPSQIGENFAIIQDSIGEKFSNIIYTVACIASGICIAFYSGSDFAVICLAYFPFIFIVLTMFGGQVRKAAIAKIMIVKRMGGVVEESLSAIRLIASFAQEEREIKKFEKLASEVKEVAHKSEYWVSGFNGLFRFAIFGFYCYSLWIASVYIKEEINNPNTGKPYTITDVISVLVGLMTGMTMVFGLNPNIQAIIKAKVVGRMVFDVIDRIPLINDHIECVESFQLEDSIQFRGVTFKYPTSSEKAKNVLEEASFEIKAGQTTAIVGPSGSGKSTIIQMIERFYDPLAGEIYVDNINLKDIKLKNLRESIGYVSQEPVLILGTIRDNLLFGNKDASEQDIEYAIKMANAGFIYEMENQLDTYVGSTAVLNLSGGQKQRIAIARALIKRPKIIILDEATSALDPKSEKEVQGAIDKISSEESKLTIIMIAHRLQTIMTAKNLLYLESKDSVVPATKGTPEYVEIMNRLQETNYAHQIEDKIVASMTKDESFESDQKLQTINDSQDTDNSQANVKLKQDKDDNTQELKPVGMLKIMSYYTPKWLSYLVYLITVINAFGFPMYGLIFSKILFIMLVPQSITYYEDRNFWCGLFILLIFALAIFGFLNKNLYAYLGENLTYTLRNKLYAGILYKHLGWFDNRDRAPGILSNVLSEDITLLNGLTSEVIASLLEAFLCLFVGITLCFIFTWRMALVALAATPFVIAGGVIMSNLQWKLRRRQQGAVRVKGRCDPYEQANALLSDMLINYKTVISFGEKNVEFVMDRFDSLLEEPNRVGIRNAHFSGFWFGYSKCVRFFFQAFVFYVASIFIFDYGDNSDDTFIGLYLLLVSALGSANAISSAPSVSKAKNAAMKVFDIIEEESNIDTRSNDGQKVIKEGQIELKNVDFKYPSREKMVLDKMNMIIPATKKIALVGHSGCGKSTIASLLLRMYDIMDGQLLIDGVDIRKYNVKELRRQIGIVMQEPLLFNMSIKENILYGNDQASDQRVREIAEMTNSLAFIESNIEDLSKEEVQEQIENSFKEFINNGENKRLYPCFNILLHKYFDEKIFNITELQFIQEILQKGDERLRNLINEDIERFSTVILDNSQIKGIKWDDLVLRYEWTFEADLIRDHLMSEYAQNLKEYHKNAILTAIKNFPTKFDIETVHEFQKQAQFLERPEDTESLLSVIISNSFDRIKKQNNSRIMSLHQAYTQNKDFKLHEGFDKNCGLKGSMLSGGQKQRIAIARALIKDPKILILDEATSALDEQSQELVQQALDRAMEGRTSVVIAHRLSTIRNCEWLFVIHNGKVVEQGTYDELSANQDSYFYKLKSGMEM